MAGNYDESKRLSANNIGVTPAASAKIAKYCAACGAPMEAQDKFCNICGTQSLTVEDSRCYLCGTELPKTAKFCHKCGAKRKQ